MRGARRARRLVAPAAVVGLLTAACDVPTFGAPRPVTRQGGHIFSLWQGFFLAACAVGAFMLALILYTVIRYRARGEEIPDQGSSHRTAEVLYTGTPIAIVVVLFVLSVGTERLVTRRSAAPAEVVEVTAFQWGWEFRYPAEGVTVTGAENDPVPELVVPVGATTRLKLEAHDVIHSFFVPEFLEKRDLVPGLHNVLDITPTRTGVFAGRCAEYCGLDHWRMDFSARVVAEPEFRHWAQQQAAQQQAARP
ncbi:MAG TPA: cytochrome c oxidase subunit II [Acidimicrobiia bacterium]|nr:cytochrome c oxidase subunit II [Acidimicrobiia bacterium]